MNLRKEKECNDFDLTEVICCAGSLSLSRKSDFKNFCCQGYYKNQFRPWIHNPWSHKESDMTEGLISGSEQQQKKFGSFFFKAKWVLLVTKWGCLWHQISLSFWKQGCESLMLLGTGWSFQCCINSPQFSKHLIDMHMYTDFFSSYIAFFMYHEFISGCDVSKHYY